GLDDVRYELTGTYPERDFCVQYRESDFAFASRLMEDEGISYYFNHSDGKHELIVTDAPALVGAAPYFEPVVFDPAATAGLHKTPRVWRWHTHQDIRAGSVTLDDYHFELPDRDLRMTQTTVADVTAGKVQHSLKLANGDLEIYDYPAGFAKPFDGV